MTRHCLADDDLTPAEQAAVLERAAAYKTDRYATRDVLAGRAVAVVFEKPSTRPATKERARRLPAERALMRP